MEYCHVAVPLLEHIVGLMMKWPRPPSVCMPCGELQQPINHMLTSIHIQHSILKHVLGWSLSIRASRINPRVKALEYMHECQALSSGIKLSLVYASFFSYLLWTKPSPI